MVSISLNIDLKMASKICTFNYSIMKKTRSTYHYMLRTLKKKKHSKTRASLSKSMLRIKNNNYWKTARVERKNKFNCTNVVDGVKDDSQIANLFKDKYERLFIGYEPADLTVHPPPQK